MAHVDVNELDPEKTVVVATGNPHKVTEIEAILAPVLPGTRFVALGELGDFEDPVEDGDTFEANALIKARAALAEVGLDSVADDSGLVVDALGGAPGILSARWADARRTARFHSTVALVRRDGTVLVGNGDCEGTIARDLRGEHGFGYDPLFCPADTPGLRMAELDPERKNEISHRYHALVDLAAKL